VTPVVPTPVTTPVVATLGVTTAAAPGVCVVIVIDCGGCCGSCCCDFAWGDACCGDACCGDACCGDCADAGAVPMRVPATMQQVIDLRLNMSRGPHGRSGQSCSLGMRHAAFGAAADKMETTPTLNSFPLHRRPSGQSRSPLPSSSGGLATLTTIRRASSLVSTLDLAPFVSPRLHRSSFAPHSRGCGRRLWALDVKAPAWRPGPVRSWGQTPRSYYQMGTRRA
jgi:hypothetical protein